MNGRRALPPDVRDEIVRVFAAALQQVREQETELLRLSLYKLELLRDGMVTLNADLRAGKLDRTPKVKTGPLNEACKH
jgi:hypothetical protein